jgi:hypothetical protein
MKSNYAPRPRYNRNHFRSPWPLAIVSLICLFWLASTGYGQLQTNLPAVTNNSATERFDDLVRDDFFAGDNESLQRGMKICEDALAKNPANAPAMSWQGNGWLLLAGQSFRAGDYAKGGELWQRGLKEMNDAVALQPDSLQVLIPRAATFLAIAKYVPNPDESKKLISTSVTDYEKVLKLQTQWDQVKTMPIHSRGELLSALAEGWFRLGETNKSLPYLRQITNDCAGSAYAKNAGSWLETIAAKAPNKPETLTCIGCHNR